MSLILENLIVLQEIGEIDDGLLSGAGDVADVLAPIVGAPTDDADQLSHAIQRHSTHLVRPCHVDGAVWVLEILGSGVDEDRPSEVVVCSSWRRSWTDSRLSAVDRTKLVVLCPNMVEELREGAWRNAVAGASTIMLTLTEGHLLYGQILRNSAHRGCVGRVSRSNCGRSAELGAEGRASRRAPVLRCLGSVRVAALHTRALKLADPDRSQLLRGAVIALNSLSTSMNG
jgi:hypothetical protein